MSIIIFRTKYKQLKDFSRKLKKEDVPVPIQKAMLKHYAMDLKLILTSKMITELISS